MNKSYSELITLKSFKERYEYLQIKRNVCESTFGSQRFLNQDFYNSKCWRNLRNRVIARDLGFDMALDGYPADKIVIHHINPITVEDFENDSPLIFDMENLVCVDYNTHQAIHYGTFDLIKPVGIVVRRPNDTIPWR